MNQSRAETRGAKDHVSAVNKRALLRQRPSTNAELPVDGCDDQLTSGSRAAASLIHCARMILDPSRLRAALIHPAAPGPPHARGPCACPHAIGFFRR